MTRTPLLHPALKTCEAARPSHEYDKIARQCASEGRSRPLPVETRRARLIPRAPWSSGASRRRASPWHASTLRLQGHPLAQQGAGPGAALRTSSSARTSSRSATVGARRASPSDLGVAACQKTLEVGTSPPPRFQNSSMTAEGDQGNRFQKKLATYKLPIRRTRIFEPLRKTSCAELLLARCSAKRSGNLNPTLSLSRKASRIGRCEAL